MAGWWSIEVFHGEFSARRWQDTYSSALIESALAHGATNWEWHEHRWGVAFEVEFGTDTAWEAFRALPLVQAALRGPRPGAGAGAVSLPEPGGEPVVHLVGVTPPGVPEPAEAGAL